MDEEADDVDEAPRLSDATSDVPWLNEILSKVDRIVNMIISEKNRKP